MAIPRVTSVMVLRGIALALLLFVLVPAVPAAAEETRAQKLFRNRLLNDRERLDRRQARPAQRRLRRP